MALLKYFKCIELSKEKIESVLPKPDGTYTGTFNGKLNKGQTTDFYRVLSLAVSDNTLQNISDLGHVRLATNNAVREILTNNSIDEDSPSPCNKIC